MVTSSDAIVSCLPKTGCCEQQYLIWEHDLTRFDLPFQAWAQRNPKVLDRVQPVYDQRLSWIRQMFRELGFKGEDLEMRTRLFVGYHSWERTVFPQRREQIVESVCQIWSPAGRSTGGNLAGC